MQGRILYSLTHSVNGVLGIFSSRPNWVPGGQTRMRKREWRGPIPSNSDEGTDTGTHGIFMYRRPTLYPLEIAVDFLKSP